MFSLVFTHFLVVYLWNMEMKAVNVKNYAFSFLSRLLFRNKEEKRVLTEVFGKILNSRKLRRNNCRLKQNRPR